MATTPRRLVGLAAGLLAFSLVAAACGDDSSNSGGDSSSTSAATGGDTSTTTGSSMEELGAATLNASGATFPKAFYDEAIAEFKDVQPKVTINYAGGGSGKGRTDLAGQVVDWAGSDSPIKDEDLPTFKGGDVLYFPTVVAPITVAYNLDVEGIKLSGPTIAKIFQREIKTWNDPAIAAENSGVTLPNTAITVARRSDSSGTTDNFTKFLVASAPDVWKLKSGSTVEWPADTQGGNGNGGVAQIVSSTAGAIGYVDFSDAIASGLKFADVMNKAGKYVTPSVEGATAAADKAEIKDNLTFSAIWADGDEAYPITAQTWILAYKKQTDKAKGLALKAFLEYILTDGQQLAGDIDFGALPSGLDDKAKAQLDTLEIPS